MPITETPTAEDKARLQKLRALPPTTSVEAKLAEALRKAEDPARHFEIFGARAEAFAKNLVETAKAQLEDARERDRIHARRPAGCWCLGLGSDMADEIDIGFGRFCSCADGDQARQELILRRVGRAVVHAQIPPRFRGYTFESYPESGHAAAKAAVLGWVDRANISRPEGYDEQRRPGLILHGPFGTGKTGLAVAALKRRLLDDGGGNALFLEVPAMFEAMRAEYQAEPRPGRLSLLERAKAADILVLDDLGAERLTEWAQERLFQIVNYRSSHLAETIVTTNLKPSELAAHSGERIIWRLIEASDVVKVAGRNLRDRAGLEG